MFPKHVVHRLQGEECTVATFKGDEVCMMCHANASLAKGSTSRESCQVCGGGNSEQRVDCVEGVALSECDLRDRDGGVLVHAWPHSGERDMRRSCGGRFEDGDMRRGV